MIDSMKTSAGNFFEDFRLGQKYPHATPRTLTTGDAALYAAIYGSRFALQSAESFARMLGYAQCPLDDLLVFHTVFGKSVPDISLNAVANLGYAECQFLRPVYPGETLFAHSEVIGLKENSDKRTGIVYVRTIGEVDAVDPVLSYVRWVMVRKRESQTSILETHVPALKKAVTVEELLPPPELLGYDFFMSGDHHKWNDYAAGEKIDHVDGTTIEEAEHAMATRLYQNTARVHFNRYEETKGRFGRRIVYGGHVISVARTLSFNGLANAFAVAAINGGRHVNPVFADDTIFAWSEILDAQPLAGRTDIGALRLRLVATKNLPCAGFPDKNAEGQYPENVVLDFDYWALMPRR